MEAQRDALVCEPGRALFCTLVAWNNTVDRIFAA